MCVIAVCEEGLSLDKETFTKCWEANYDGAGFGWIDGEEICFSKGHMDIKSAWKAYRMIKAFPHIAHFRMTSAGSTCPELTHPFLITAESPVHLSWRGPESILFHNGTVTGWRTLRLQLALAIGKLPEGKASDTRTMAQLAAILGDAILVEDTGKYATISPEGLNIWGTWDEKDGVHFSNLFWDRRYLVKSGWDKWDDKNMSNDDKKYWERWDKRANDAENAELWGKYPNYYGGM